MKAIRCHANGMPEDLVVDDVDDLLPGPGQVVIDVHAAALNFPDVLMIQGKYQSQPPFPFSPGGEVSGIVRAVGDGVDNVKIGDPVFAGSGVGGFAEQAVMPAAATSPVPKGMSFAQASGIRTTYGTSYYALKQRAQLKAGETLLVLGAAGGVGIAAVELGKAMGARVIAAASSDEKLAAAKAAGADELINYSDGQIKDKVKALTDGKGADVIYDPVGGELFDQCMRCINWDGRILVIGFAAGDIPKVPINLVLLKSCQIVGVFYGAWVARSPAENASNFAEILAFHADGKINPLVGKTFAFNDYAAALRCLMDRRAIGKVVLEVRS
ncbi:MAG: NADPH:quinone oxidoreductase family protein [Pseudomonadaceae bacterium]|nr:NADPH:quinone oxidoreductase family protein [Pseudomonadaceae bacterium]